MERGCIIPCNSPPTIINPLSVSVNNGGKKRLILDLRYVNSHIFKFSVKYEGLNVLRNYVNEGGFVISFDLKSGYHHLGIFPEHQKYLGFSWLFNGKICYFKFTVLPFGLSSACSIFTKLLKPLVSKWRGEGINIVLYLDDGICTDINDQKLKIQSDILRNDLSKAGFVINEEKSQLTPVRSLKWLGFIIDLSSFTIRIPEEKIEGLMISLTRVLEAGYCTARNASSIVGKITSLEPAVGSSVFFYTRNLQKFILDIPNWDMPQYLDIYSRNELSYWSENIQSETGCKIQRIISFSRTIYCDASSYAGGGYVDNFDNLICHFTWNFEESLGSSTFRELKTVFNVLKSFRNYLENQNVRLFTDNTNVVSILRKGSMNEDLNILALNTYELCKSYSINIFPKWIPREQNVFADSISRIIDHDDYRVANRIFQYFDCMWGPHTFDRFANGDNAKCENFNSKYFCPGSKGTDAFTQDWSDHINWLFPPVRLLCRVIIKIQCQRVRSTLIVPKWKSAPFWPLLVTQDGEFKEFITDFKEYVRPSAFFESINNKVFGEHFRSNVIVLKTF